MVGKWIIIIIIILINDIFYQKMSQKEKNDKKKKKRKEKDTLGDLPQGLALNGLARILCPSNSPR